MSIRYGGQYIIHFSNSRQASYNEGTFELLRVVNELNLLLPQVFDSADLLLYAGLISVTFASTAAMPGIESAQS